jgi:hypothetical protein
MRAASYFASARLRLCRIVDNLVTLPLAFWPVAWDTPNGISTILDISGPASQT